MATVGCIAHVIRKAIYKTPKTRTKPPSREILSTQVKPIFPPSP